MAEILEVGYKASRRYWELWSPLPYTNNVQIWLATLSFMLAIFFFCQYPVAKVLHVLGVDLFGTVAPSPETLPTRSIVWSDIPIAIIGTLAAICALGAFGSLVILFIRGLRNQKVPQDPDNISRNIAAGMSKAELDRIRLMRRSKVEMNNASDINKESIGRWVEQGREYREARDLLNQALSEMKGEGDCGETSKSAVNPK